jgi:thiosulfate/3-mercaptopyruvate sulfurtransferase
MDKVYSIIELSKNGRLDLIRDIFESNPLHPINEKDKYGKTPFLYAAQNDYLNILEYLNNEGADINTIDNYGNNALSLAIGFNSFSTAKYLLDLGISANSKFNGEPILHIAISSHNMEIIDKLLDWNADPTISNKDGLDAFKIAKRNLPVDKYNEFNNLLIDHGWN